MALILCQDVHSSITTIYQEDSSQSHLNSVITSNLLNLHNCGVKKFVFVFFENAKDIVEELLSFFCCFLPDCLVQFQEEKNMTMGVGDIILSKKDLFKSESHFLVMSWRAIPDFPILQGFIGMCSTSASILVCKNNMSMQIQSIPFDPQTDRLVGMDKSSSTQFASDCGVYCFQKDCLDSVKSSVQPTSVLQLLYQLKPNSVEVIFLPPSSELCTVEITYESSISELCLLLDGAVQEVSRRNGVYSCSIQAGSTLRYLYAKEDALGSIQSYENRGIPREVFIPKQPTFKIKDCVAEPLQPTHLLQNACCIILSLERWRTQANLVFKSVQSPQIVKKTPSTVILQTHNQDFDAVTLTIEDKQLAKEFAIEITSNELSTLLFEKSMEHHDGILFKTIEHQSIELKIVMIPSIHPTLHHQLLTGYSHLYRPLTPLEIGHRGCGVNSLDQQSEIENTIHSFTEAHNRGLSAIECDLQLSKDRQVVIFHDYAIENNPIAQSTARELQAIPLPSPAGVKTPQYMPTMREMSHCLPSSLQFNLEVKYPTLNELPMAELNCSKNEYINTIITTVEGLHSSRMIFYSSFDPDICLHLLYKQAIYPVFLLLDEDSGCPEVPKKQWVQFNWKLYVKLNLEKGSFRGVVAEISLLDEASVKWLHSLGLLVYCWGKEGNCKEKRDYLYSIGVDAIIADTFQ